MQLKLSSSFGAIALCLFLFGCESPAAPGPANSSEKPAANTEQSGSDTEQPAADNEKSASETEQPGADNTLLPFVGTWTWLEPGTNMSTLWTLTVTSNEVRLAAVTTGATNGTLEFTGTLVATTSSGASDADFVVRYTDSDASGEYASLKPTEGQFSRLSLLFAGDSLTCGWSGSGSTTAAEAKTMVLEFELPSFTKS